MLEYVRRLLLAQTRLAAQFDTAPQPEIREVTLRSEQEAGDAQEQSTQSREKRPGLMQAGAEMDGTETWSAEQALREMARQTMRLESMQLQKSAQAQLEQTRKMPPNRVPGAHGLYSNVPTSEYSGFTLNPSLMSEFALRARS